MKVFIRRNRYAIAACAVALAAVATLGFYGIAQASATENEAADANVEQRWEGDARALAVDETAADLIEAQGPESATGTENAAGAEVNGVEEAWEETGDCNVAVDEETESGTEVEEAYAGDRIEGEVSASNEYVEVNVSASDDPVEQEERPAA